MTVVYKTKEILVPRIVELDQSVGLSNIPNRRLVESKHSRHPFNLVLIGAAGCGKSTLINALACKQVLPDSRPRYPEGLSTCSIASYHAELEEGGVVMDLTVSEVLGYGEAHGEAFKILLAHVQDHLRAPLHEQLELEYAGLVPPQSPSQKFVHAVLFFVPPNNGGLSSKDREMLEGIKELAFIIPVLTKADCYTPEELRERKHQIRKSLEQIGVQVCPGDSDSYYQNLFDEIEERWPLACISSIKTIGTVNGLIRGRAYPWGNINIDDESFNDLVVLQKILFGYLNAKLKLHADQTVYEAYRRNFLPELIKSHTPDALRTSISQGKSFLPTQTPQEPPTKIDIIAKKALERLRLSSSMEYI